MTVSTDWPYLPDDEIRSLGLTHCHAALPCPPGWDQDDVYRWTAQGLQIPHDQPGTEWINFYSTPGYPCDLCDAGHLAENDRLDLAGLDDGSAIASLERMIDDASPPGSR